MWAWNEANNELTMVEGDWGLELPITINGLTISQNDEFKLFIKTSLNGGTILTKTFSNVSNNKIILTLTKAESDLFRVGTYVYSLDWYQDGAFNGNIVRCAPFKVVDKA